MIRVIDSESVFAPENWLVCFDRKAANWFWSAIACGRYKHVRAFAFVPEMRVWVFYDVQAVTAEIFVAHDGPGAERLIGQWVENAEVVHVKRRARSRRWFRVGFWCVPAIKHLLGLRCVALRPDALYRHCLKIGDKFADGETLKPA